MNMVVHMHYAGKCSRCLTRALPPLMTWLISPTGSWKGKSTEASIWAKNIHLMRAMLSQVPRQVEGHIPSGDARHEPKRSRSLMDWPSVHIFNAKSGQLTIWSFNAISPCPSANCQYDPARSTKVMNNPKKMATKVILVLKAHTR